MQEKSVRERQLLRPNAPLDPMGAFEQVMKEHAVLLLADGFFRVTEVYRPTGKVVLRFAGLAPRGPAVTPYDYRIEEKMAAAQRLETGPDFWSEAGMEV